MGEKHRRATHPSPPAVPSLEAVQAGSQGRFNKDALCLRPGLRGYCCGISNNRLEDRKSKKIRLSRLLDGAYCAAAPSPAAAESPVAETVKHCEERIWFPAMLHFPSDDLKQSVKRVGGNWPPGVKRALDCNPACIFSLHVKLANNTHQMKSQTARWCREAP